MKNMMTNGLKLQTLPVLDTSYAIAYTCARWGIIWRSVSGIVKLQNHSLKYACGLNVRCSL